MSLPKITAAAEQDRDRVIQTIVIGFTADPVGRWFWPEAKDYMEGMALFAAAFGGGAIANGTADVADGFKAAALWLGPGVEPDGEAIEKLVAETVNPDILEEGAEFFGKMDEFHPEFEHWYLPLIAADPAYIGQGLGAALMKHAVERCDKEGLPAYLESSNPRNISLYERHGFETIGEIQVGSSPLMTPMLRPARG